MAKVDSLKDSTGTIIYPKTVSTAVYDESTQKTVKESLAETKNNFRSCSAYFWLVVQRNIGGKYGY